MLFIGLCGNIRGGKKKAIESLGDFAQNVKIGFFLNVFKNIFFPKNNRISVSTYS